jgi:predicted transcriptional regulator
MPGKRVQFDDETWQAIEAVADLTHMSFQNLADEALADFLKKHKQPVGLKAALKESVAGSGKAKRPSK